MIRLDIRKEETEKRKEAKSLGARWNGTYWYIPDNEDWHKFEKWMKWIPEDWLEKLDEIAEPTFDKLFEDIYQNVPCFPFMYKIEADVHSVSKDRAYCDLIVNHKWYRKLRVYLGNNENFPSKKELENKKVEVEGFLSLYNTQLQLTATRITPIGDCSRLVTISKWEKECSDFLRSVEETEDQNKIWKRKNQVFDFTDIGLIAVKDSDGYRDFMDTIKTPEDRIHTGTIDTMTAENMASAIRKFIKDADCQCICIVRGGGNQEQLMDFSNPVLLRAINESNKSNIPVITGVGHKNYNLLCKRAAFYDAGTPTDAANHLNNVWKRLHHKKPDRDAERDAIIAEKDAKIRELEQEIERLKKKDNGGLWGLILSKLKR